MTQKVNPFLKLMPKKPEAQPEKAEAKPVESTPPKANPLTSLLTNEPAPTKDESSEPSPGTASELAAMNTESFEPQMERQASLPAQAAQRAKKLILESQEEVRELCDRVDQMIESNEQLAGPPLFELRTYVQQLMVTLKERPEFDGVIIDKDVRNIMRFIRATREETLALRDIKVEKKAVRAAKKEKTASLNKGFADAFNAALGSKLKL